VAISAFSMRISYRFTGGARLDMVIKKCSFPETSIEPMADFGIEMQNHASLRSQRAHTNHWRHVFRKDAELGQPPQRSLSEKQAKLRSLYLYTVDASAQDCGHNFFMN
jgi:hypothetical protein